AVDVVGHVVGDVGDVGDVGHVGDVVLDDGVLLDEGARRHGGEAGDAVVVEVHLDAEPVGFAAVRPTLVDDDGVVVPAAVDHDALVAGGDVSGPVIVAEVVVAAGRADEEGVHDDGVTHRVGGGVGEADGDDGGGDVDGGVEDAAAADGEVPV